MKIQFVKDYKLVPEGEIREYDYEIAQSLIDRGFAKSLEEQEEVQEEVQEEEPVKKPNKK